MLHSELLLEPDMLVHLHDETIVDHRAAASLALKHHCNDQTPRGDPVVMLVDDLV